MPLPIMSFKPVLGVLAVKQSAKVNDPVIAVEWKKRGRPGSIRADLNATRPRPPGQRFPPVPLLRRLQFCFVLLTEHLEQANTFFFFLPVSKTEMMAKWTLLCGWVC